MIKSRLTGSWGLGLDQGWGQVKVGGEVKIRGEVRNEVRVLE